jgi:tetratricopeptide (TPR) repeat protein
LICATIFAAPTAAQDLRAIGQLARDGAPGLAISLLDQAQPDFEQNPEGWLFFEHQRIEILRGWQQWEALLARLADRPKGAPADFEHWAVVEMANAELRLGRGENALHLLRRLLWQPPGVITVEQFSLYRRLVIRAYLVDDRLEDARRAMLRYQQDYGKTGSEWRGLQARVLLLTGRAEDAEQLLAAEQTPGPETHALKLLAQLRAQKRPAASILGEARKAAGGKDVSAANQARLWQVGAEAASLMGERLTATRTLEKAALLAHAIPPGDNLFKFNGDELWKAYRTYAVEEGNAMQLLIGQDQRWLSEAEKWVKDRPEKARAFYTIVMLNATSPEMRAKAYELFLNAVLAMPDGIRLVQKLFLDTGLFPTTGSIPNPARYLLVDDALSRNDIALATRLMSGLAQAPDNADPVEWGLRRARVLILGGRHEEGVEVLAGMIDDVTGLNRQTQDRLVQVIFDLQTVGKHEAAISLFDKLLKQSLAPEFNRELLFWQADSYKALGRHAKAAWRYLQSATLLDARGMDPWGQTARFHAAEVLADAGLVDDARRLYEGLLKATRDPSRQATIKYKLQELWLKQPRDTEPRMDGKESEVNEQEPRMNATARDGGSADTARSLYLPN